MGILSFVGTAIPPTNFREGHMANNNFAVGSVVVNFGQTAMVVALFDRPGTDHNGHPILRALSADRKQFVGGKWVADPSKCELAQ